MTPTGTLYSGERLLTDASMQFYNVVTSSGSFSATLRLYNAAPVGIEGSRIGGDFTLNGIAAASFGLTTVSFSGFNLVVPETFVFNVAMSNIVGALDLGLSVFNPPVVGSSDNTKAVFRLASDLSFVDGPVTLNGGNLCFLAQAVPVPETSSVLMLGMGLLVLTLKLKLNKRRSAGG